MIFIDMNEVFTKSCYKCGNIQTYINILSFKRAVKNNNPPNIIGNIKNLEFIQWRGNIKKRTKNSININELIL